MKLMTNVLRQGFAFAQDGLVFMWRILCLVSAIISIILMTPLIGPLITSFATLFLFKG